MSTRDFSLSLTSGKGRSARHGVGVFCLFTSEVVPKIYGGGEARQRQEDW